MGGVAALTLLARENELQVVVCKHNCFQVYLYLRVIYTCHRKVRISVIKMQWFVVTFSVHLNGHFPGESGLAGVYWSKGWWKWWCQLELQVVQSSSQIITINKPTPNFFTGRMPCMSPNQQCQSTEGEIHSKWRRLIVLTDLTVGLEWLIFYSVTRVVMWNCVLIMFVSFLLVTMPELIFAGSNFWQYRTRSEAVEGEDGLLQHSPGH